MHHNGNTVDDELDRMDDNPDIDPDVTVVSVRGEKQVGFKGLKHIGMNEADKDQIHEVYDDIIIELDNVKDQFQGVDRAWHIGRVMDEYNVQENDDMTLKDLGAFNTIEDMYARRLFYARYIYSFWPDKQYNPTHSVTSLGELASRGINGGWETDTKQGYNRILDHDEEVLKHDVLTWYPLKNDYGDPTVADIVTEATEHYETAESIAEATKRVTLLLNRPLTSVSKNELKDAIETVF